MPRPRDKSNLRLAREKHDDQAVVSERDRVLAEYRRREREIDGRLYAPWQPAEALMRTRNRTVAAQLLHKAGVFPAAGTPCLEVGFGSLGWLADLISWGVRDVDLHGVELDRRRAALAQAKLPNADLRVGDATQLPWDADTFHLVIASTVFTSILDGDIRRKVAREIQRVLVPGGALLWYDFIRNNPANPHVRKVSRREVRELFPELSGEMRSITLAPPIARVIAPRSWAVATALEAIPFFRTHMLGVLVKAGVA
jgi:SAM-dependent methyltransferase